jgi:D-glycero-alpha-D-manno-heptose 1-phosphate guanylyltransferase
MTGMRIDAAIIAGGLGTRLRPIMANCPKALVPVNGIPFITFLLDQLVEARVSKVVVCAGHLGGQLRRALGCECNGLPVAISQEDWPMGTGGALRQAVDYFSADMVLVMNGDSYVDTSLARFCQWAATQPWESAMLLTWVEDCARFGTVDLSRTGRILAFEEKCGAPTPGWINGGVYLLPRAWIAALPEDTPLSLETDVFPYWIERGIGGYRVRAPFLDIGTPECMAQAESFFASVRRKSEWKNGSSS